jgi:hypothetical protein
MQSAVEMQVSELCAVCGRVYGVCSDSTDEDAGTGAGVKFEYQYLFNLHVTAITGITSSRHFINQG